MTIDYRTQTVLITGASSGIGAEFARRFAARGAGVVLVARRLDRLEKLAAELTDRHGVRAVPLAADLTTPGVGALLDKELTRRGIEITAIVNNAGFATHGPFHEENPDRLAAEIAVDVTSVVDISRTFIERLRRRGDGFLLNVASMAAYQGNPTMAVYGATKAFVHQFSQNLRSDLLGTPVRVTVVEPGMAETEFSLVRFGGDAAKARNVYEGVEPLQPGDVADVVLWCLTRPAHVNVNVVEVMPVQQAFGPFAVNRKA